VNDLVDAIELTVEHRAALPPELPVLLGEPEPLSYDGLQHTFARLIHGEDWETLEVPEPLAPLAKAGAWVMEKLPGAGTKKTISNCRRNSPKERRNRDGKCQETSDELRTQTSRRNAGVGEA
jgi:hypothetical protein